MKRLRLTWFLFCIASISAIAPWTLQAGELDPQRVEFFETKIRPVLVQHCDKCHSPKAKHVRGGLQLHTRAATHLGGDSGPAVVPGKPEESLLLSALKYDSFEMPPSGKLDKQIIDDFEKWIRDGAVDPRDGKAESVRTEIDMKKGRQFWAFRQPVAPRLPTVKNNDWPESSIDHFVLKGLEDKQLSPAPPADKVTELRRWYYDLVGLPPTPEDIADYLGNDSPNADEEVVGRLLKSPRFGERWGRRWLDVARYADSTGGGRSRIYGNSWRYRDYVIKSFNDDKPYSQFVKEQIAGDLLPHENLEQQREQLTGLGFLMLGPINYELQDKYLLRMEIVDEQVSTIGKAFLGMTIGCARCHDHKFDPIPQSDYYAMAGIFRSTDSLEPGNVSGWVKRELPMEAAQQTALKNYRTQLTALQKQISQLEAKLKKANTSSVGKSVSKSDLVGIVVDTDDAKVNGEWMESVHSKTFVGEHYLHDMGTGKGQKSIEYRVELPAEGKYEVRVSYTPNSNRPTKVPYSVAGVEGLKKTVHINQRSTPKIDGIFQSLGTFDFKATPSLDIDDEQTVPNEQVIGNKVVAIVTISNAGTGDTVIADSVQIIPVAAFKKEPRLAKTSLKSSKLKIEKKPTLVAALEADQKKLAELKTTLAEVKKNAPPEPPVVMGVRDEVPDEIGDTNLCIRGNVRNLGPIVPRGVLTVASKPGKHAIQTQGSGRLELAEWLASADNPLTARVMVNRIWHHLFGTGIVRTVDNFGSMGEAPSNPELLDHLAIQFVKNNWSMKRLIREIVLSKTYRQSSSSSHKPMNVDPENRLLAHYPRRRADAEYLYDAIHSLSGQIKLATQGATVKPGTGSEYNYKFTGSHRAVFVPVFRNNIHELLQVFDFPDPNLVQGKRTTTTLSTQALYLMNNPLIIEHSKHAAKRILNIPQLSHEERIESLYLSALGRKLSEDEFVVANNYLIEALGAENSELDEISAWASLCQALIGSIDFRYID